MPLSMNFLCFCDYGDVQEDGYQYCVHCNKARPVDPVPCNHEYGEIEKFHKQGPNGQVIEITLIVKCKHCGHIVKEIVT